MRSLISLGVLRRFFGGPGSAVLLAGAAMTSCRPSAYCTDTGYDAGELVRVVVKGEAEYGINCSILPLAPGSELTFIATGVTTTDQDGCVTRGAEPSSPISLGSPAQCSSVRRTLGVKCDWIANSGCTVTTEFNVTKMPRNTAVYEDGGMWVGWGGDPSCLPAACARADHYRVRIERLGFVDAGTATD